MCSHFESTFYTVMQKVATSCFSNVGYSQSKDTFFSPSGPLHAHASAAFLLIGEIWN